MDEALIIISIITIIGTVINIQLLNHNWFKRQELKSRYKVKEIRERAKAKTKVRESEVEHPSSGSSISGLLNLAKGLDSDQLHDLIDTYTGEREPVGTGDILEDIIQNNPELVKSFLDGFTKGGKKDEKESWIGQQPKD